VLLIPRINYVTSIIVFTVVCKLMDSFLIYLILI
jgi:hypothetical protein